MKTIRVGKSPMGIATTADGSRVYVANLDSCTVSVIDTDTLTVVREPLTYGFGPTDVSMTPNHAYVANYYSGTVSVLDLATNKVVGNRIRVGIGPFRLAVTPGGAPRHVYVN
jgi:YVTN family beta-propeller protein